MIISKIFEKHPQRRPLPPKQQTYSPQYGKRVDRQIQMEKQTKIIFRTKQSWSPRHKVSVLSVCRGCHPEGFLQAFIIQNGVIITITKIMITIILAVSSN